jgi:putative transposase
MCRVLEISTSGYYAWRNRPPSRRAREDARLQEQIETIHRESRGTYGTPRVYAELAENGVRISRRRVARLMKQAGLEGVSRRRRHRTTRRGNSPQVVPDLVNRDFTADGPNQLWVADITYISTWSGFLYLAVVLDAYSRRVVGWSMADHLRTELVLEALNMAIWQRRPEQVIHHSDQGTQYTSIQFGKRCGQLGVRPSTGSVGDAYDNAMAESFFATLETELLWRETFRSQAEARMAVFGFIEGFYNPRRRHSSIGDMSPATYERRFAVDPDTEVETARSMQIAARSAQPLGNRCAVPTSSHLTAATSTQTPSVQVSTKVR